MYEHDTVTDNPQRQEVTTRNIIHLNQQKLPLRVYI